MELFVHRSDVFSEQQASGAYFPVRQPITTDDVAEHLAGLASYGSYVIRPEDQSVRYVVFDLDTHDEAAQHHLLLSVGYMLQVALGDEQPEGWTEGTFQCSLLESSGNKGTHLWVFLSAPLPAAQVRRWVTRDFMPAWEEKARPANWPIEVYPKQDGVDEGGFGNLVKLPLGKHRVSGNFSHFIRQTGWATSVDDVVPLPAELVPEVVSTGEGGGRRSGERVRPSATDGPCSPFPCVDRIMREGAPQGYRDNAMFHLALYCYGHGIDQDLAEEICVRANEEFDPPMPEREVRSKVSSAYRGRYPSATCGSGWLAELCPGPCKTGWSVRSTEGGALKSAQPGSTVDVEVVQTVRDEGRTRVTVRHPDADNTPTFLVGR